MTKGTPQTVGLHRSVALQQTGEGKTISELQEQMTVGVGDWLVLAKTATGDYRISGEKLIKATKQSLGVIAAKAASYAEGETLTLFDHSVEPGDVCGLYYVYHFSERPSYFKGDVPNVWYEVAGSNGKHLLIVDWLASAFTRRITEAGLTAIKNMMNNSGVVVYNTDRQSLCVVINHQVKELAFKGD